jgi:starch-binding outer membrane protein, SusD/RagB family
MNKFIKLITIVLPVVFIMGLFSSCETFFNPDQDIYINEEDFYTEYYEYRAAVMGLYSLQQDLVEQLVVLGELRGDLLTVTPNADADLMEIYNFTMSKNNKYVSPQNFFKLIAATNRFINNIEQRYPNVLDPTKAVNNSDRLYGEALTMRAWAYFNAARIYGKVPLIDQRLSTIEDIEAYINTPGTYTIPVYVKYALDGYRNDTLYNQEIVLEKQFYNTDQIIRYFTAELEEKIKAVGVNHFIENNDNSWEVTVWSEWGYNTLMGHMYLTLGDLAKSTFYFEKVVVNNSENFRYQLDNAFAGANWGYIFTNIDSREHIFSLSFNKANQQQNDFQRLFEPWGSNEYMLKPTKRAVHMWETAWRYAVVNYDYRQPDSTKTVFPGYPSDFYRGYGISYLYTRNENYLMGLEYQRMLEAKMNEEDRTVESIMESMDTVVVKYSLNKNVFDHDANYIIYRAGGVNLYLAEAYNYLQALDTTGVVRSTTQKALNIYNNGSNYNPSNSRRQLGVRGRVDLPAYEIQDYKFLFNPFTNKVIGYLNLTNNLAEKRLQFENDIIDERARELAFEGERFYDLMRIAKRRGDPSFLASKVAEKYTGGQRDYIYNLLLDENNWYINYFE